MAGKVRNYSSGRQSGAGSKPQSARRRKQQLAANEARLRLAVASVAAISMFASRTARATNYTWIGNTDSIWGDANWNPNATPGPSDAAIFSNAGDGNTSLSLQGVPYTIGNITFDTPFAAAYTIGSATDTLTLNNSGTILMTSLVANNQTFNTAITLGIDSTNQTFTFTNNSASNTLAFNGNITGNTSGGVKTLLVDGAGNTTISGVLAGGAAAADLGLTKLGTGTLTLNGSAVNTYTGATIASGGTLTLNFANLGATTNLINSGSALILAGGSLNVIGNPSNASAQTFNGTTFNPGMSVVSLSGSTAPTLTLGTYALTRGSTVEFVGPSEQNVLSGTGTDGSATATGTITTTNSGSGAVGLVWNASDSAIATVGLYDWASTDTTAGAAGTTIIGGSQVTGFYTQVANNGTVAIGSGNVDLLGNATLAAGSGTNTNYAATIRFNVAGNFTLNNNSGSNHSPQFGGFLITPNVGAHNITFANNATNNYAASENVTGSAIDIYQNNTGGEFLWNVNIKNATTIVQAGPGTVSFVGQSANGGYTGSTYLNGGVTEIANNYNLGNPGTAATTFLNGGTIVGNTSLALDNGANTNLRPVTLGGDGGGLAAVSTFTLTVDGVISGATGTGPLIIGIPATSANGNNTLGLVPGTGNGTANGAVYGNGTVSLTGANTFTGGTIIDSGALLYNGVQATLGSSTGLMTINNSGTLNLGANQNLTTGPVSINGGTISGTGTSTLTGSSFTSTGGKVTSILAGAGSFTNTSGTTTLSGNNSFSGGTYVNGGTLILSAANSYTGGTFVNGGTLTLTGSGTTGSSSNALSVAGGTLQLGAAGTTDSIAGFTYGGGNLAFSLNANGNSSMISAASETFTASPTVTFSVTGSLANGETFVLINNPGGTLTGGSFIASGNITPTVIGRLTLSTAQSSGNNSLVVTVSGNAASLLWSGGISGLGSAAPDGSYSQGDGSTWDNTQAAGTANWNNANNYDMYYDLDNVTFGDLTGNGTGTLSRVINLTTVNSPGSVLVNTTGNYTFQGAGSIGGTGALTVGNGTLYLATSNTYSGGTTISAGALLQTLAANALPGTGTVTVNAGTLDLGNFSQSIVALSDGGNSTGVIESTLGNETLTLSGGGNFSGVLTNGGANTGSNSLALTLTGGTLKLSGIGNYTGATSVTGGNLSLTGSLAGSIIATGATGIVTESSTGIIGGSGATFTQGSSGTSVLGGNNTYGGGTSVNAGVLQISAANNLGSGGNITFNGGTLEFTTGTFDPGHAISLAGAGTLQMDSGASITVAENITGSGSLTTTGTGNLTIAGNATYTGTTTVNSGGVLTVTGLLHGTSVLNLANGAVLNIAGGNVTLATVANDSTNGDLVAGGNSTSIYVSGGTFSYGLATSGVDDPNFAVIGNVVQTGGNITTQETDGAPVSTLSLNMFLGGGNYTSNLGQFGSFSVGTRGAADLYVDGGNLVVNGNATYPMVVGAQFVTTTATPDSATTREVVQQSGNVTTTGLTLGGLSPSAVNSPGVYYLNGGTLTTGTLNRGFDGNATYGTGTLNFGGGTFKSGAAFTTDGNISTNINSGGATIDTTGGNLTWSGVIAAGTTGNVIPPTITNPGSGYSSDPTVTITPNGAGGGATAVAEINAAGQVIDVIITNPGSGYTSAPTFGISGGGGGNATALGNAPLTANGGLTVQGAHILTLLAVNTYAGNTTINAGATLQLGNGTTGHDGTIESSSGITDNGNLVFNRFGSLASTVVIGGTGNVTMTGTGTQALNAANTYSGLTSVNNGTLAINTVGNSTTAQSLGEGGNVTLGVAGTSSGILDYTGAAGTYFGNISALGIGGDTIENTGTGLLTLAGTLAKNGTTLTLEGGTNGITISGNITGVNPNSDLVVNGGITNLTGTNTYNGPTDIINGGTLNANVTGAVPSNSPVNLDVTGSGSSTLALGASQSAASLNSSTSTSTVNLGTSNLTLTGNASTTFAGAITDSGGGALTVALTGGGSQTLTGDNTYTGGTTITSGSLFANHPTSSLGTGVVNVKGGLLAGSGTINNTTNPITVSSLGSGGSIGAGGNATAYGQLNTGAQVWNGNGTYVWKLGGNSSIGAGGAGRGTGASGVLGGASGPGNGNDEGVNWDLLNVTTGGLNLGNLTSGSPFYIAPVGAITSNSSSYSWVILQSSGDNSITLPGGYSPGNISTSTVGSDLTNGNSNGIFVLNTNNFTDGGNPVSASSFTLEAVNFASTEDLVLDYTYSAAPEPGTAMLVLAGGLPMLMARRRRKNASTAK